MTLLEKAFWAYMSLVAGLAWFQFCLIAWRYDKEQFAPGELNKELFLLAMLVAILILAYRIFYPRVHMQPLEEYLNLFQQWLTTRQS